MKETTKGKRITTISASALSSILSPDTNSIRLRRAESLVKKIGLEQRALINNLEREETDLASKLDDLADLAPNDTTSLRFGEKDFDAAKWVGEVQSTKERLETTKFKLKIARETLAEFSK